VPRLLVWALPLAILTAACAARAPAPGAPAAAEAPDPPPAGSKRLPSSISCEPEPPCGDDCTSATGEAGRRLGSLDKEDIRRVIRSHVADMKTCYDAITEAHPDAAGKVMVRFGIAPSGVVQTSCLVSSDLNDTPADRCIVDVPLRWTFPKPEGGGWVVVNYPFVFSR